MMQQFALMGLQSLSTFIREKLEKDTGKTDEVIFEELSVVHIEMFDAGKKALLKLGYTIEDESEGQLAGTVGAALAMLYVSHGANVFQSYLLPEEEGDNQIDDMLNSLE